MKFGPVCLRTNSLDSMLGFYKKELGLEVMQVQGNVTVLGCQAANGANEPILILNHDEKALSRPSDAAGLYHFALLVPDRKSLAAACVSLGNKGVVFDGYADHQVSEALYLTDPDGNGIEIYADRPRREWKFDGDGEVEMATLPLDLDSLIKELPHGSHEESITIAEGTRVDHIHIKVTDLERSIEFYTDILGLEVMRYLGSAAFLSTGRYHHHIGMNTWESLGGPPAQKTWVGLEYFVISIPETNLHELSSRLGIGFDAHDGPKQVFASDPDEISIIFKSS
jgi:catechol 2,3-dioxygenase